MTKVLWQSLGVLLVGGAVGCGAPGQDGPALLQDDPISQGVTSENGLTAVNGLSATNGLTATNGLMTTNGLSTTNGLMTTNGLSTTNGLMTTNGGKSTVEYLARCALANNDYFDKNGQRFYGRLGLGTGWKNGACDSSCQQKISACMMAHMNSTGNKVPIYINADPNKMPSVGFSEAYQAGSDAHIQEGLFFGNMLAENPPQAWYVKGDGFKASIPGRLGASSSNPYKAWSGYRPDDNVFYNGVADGLCMGRTLPDGEHFEYYECGKSDAPYGMFRGTWQNVLVTYVNSNYNGAVTQNWTSRTLDFQGDSVGMKTLSRTDVWTTAYNMEFKNTVSDYSSGRMELKETFGSKRLCVANNDHIVITKNSGEPFSLTSLKFTDEFSYGGNQTVKISGYSKGSSTKRTDTVNLSGIVSKTLNWDGLLKVEIRAPVDANICIDDVVVKT